MRWSNLTANVTSKPSFFLHAPCVPDQIRRLVSGEKNVRGTEGFVNRGEEDKIKTNRNVVVVTVVEWVLQRVE